MKFLRDKKLRQLGALALLLALLVFIAQYFMLGYKMQRLEESQLKIEYTQFAELHNQKISLQVQQFLNGNETLGPAIIAQIDKQEHLLKTLSGGGRTELRDQFLQPLTRLPLITYSGLQEDWNNYRHAVYLLVTGGEVKEEAPKDSVVLTSQDAVARLVKTSPAAARIHYEGLSLTLDDWYEKLKVDLFEEVDARELSLSRWKLSFLLIDGLLLFGIFYLFNTQVLRPLSVLESNTKQHIQTKDLPPHEVGMLAESINETLENLKDATDFVVAIGKGDLSICYKESLDSNYTKGRNKLADSLIEMQSRLKELNEEEKKRQWANDGLARFVEILRSSNDDIRVLGDRIISALIHYTGSNQGALYILNDEDNANIHLELISVFAWDVKKIEQQRIKPGQGILGQTFLEKETTYLTQLPEEYVRITSGLGGANPKSLLIVPLKVDKDVYGLVELASFNDYQAHEIAFVEKLGETIASTLASVKSTQKNKVLIEQFQQQTEEMRAQEEEMRQNMEELQATQEEVVRKEKTYVERIRELETLVNEKVDKGDIARLQELFALKEKEYELKIEQLNNELAKRGDNANDWNVAEELHRTLRVQLEALRITQKELDLKYKG